MLFCLAVTIFAMNTSAFAIENGLEQTTTDTEFSLLDPLPLMDAREQAIVQDTCATESDQKETMERGPAPPLTSFYICAVRSEMHPDWDYFSGNYSNYNHGGAWTIVAIVEIGYANRSLSVTKLDGVKMDLSKFDYIVDSGNTVIGAITYWIDYSGTGNGLVNAQSTSINSPWNTMYDAKYVN